jgi:Arc/MetJ-type ribon-helix-helix transcriptional regulator
MARIRGSGTMGPVRSFRLPGPLDAWLEERLALHLHKSFSEVIVELVHGGLRLREGYMAVHRHALERLAREEDPHTAAGYRRALEDTFGPGYLDHVDKWIAADAAAEASPPRP